MVIALYNIYIYIYIKNLNQTCCKIAPNMNEVPYCKDREGEAI